MRAVRTAVAAVYGKGSEDSVDVPQDFLVDEDEVDSARKKKA